MKLHNWRIFNKQGSIINWFSDSYLNLSFSGPGKNAEGYFITDPCALVIDSKITNSGYLYDNTNNVASYEYTFDPDAASITLESRDASISYVDVSIFNPTLTNTLGIEKLFPMSLKSRTDIHGLVIWDGADDYVSFGSLPDVKGDKEIEFDIYLTKDSGYTTVVDGIGICTFNAADSSDYVNINLYDDQMRFYVTNASTNKCFYTSITGLADDWITVKMFKTQGEVLGVTFDDVSVSLIALGQENLAVDYSWIAASPGGTLEDAYIKDFKIIDSSTIWYHWKGYPAGNTDAAWVDQEASINGTINGLPNIVTNFTMSSSDLTFVYPSVTYAGAIFLQPVSQNLVETEHLFILEETSTGYIRPYDGSNSTLVFEMVGEDTEIQLFSINENEQIVEWTDSLEYDIGDYILNTPITINIGFRAEDEGVFERRLRIYHVIGDEWFTMGEILVNAQSIGEDERYRTLLSNFGLPDPKNFPHLFKEANINEAYPDYKIINPKSKEMILEHDNIIPYIGTYKALINAIKWLGYDDIYIREWFKNVKENKKLSLFVPFNAADRTQTILSFSPEERKVLKKLNQLTLGYHINEETGNIDEWGIPETENSYDYTIQEVFVKLLSLKKWLEQKIIGVNARIIDITGEGVYFDRFKNLVHATQNIGYTYSAEQSLSPITTTDDSELVSGESSIGMTLKELSLTKIKDMSRFEDYVDYLWDPSTGLTYSLEDASMIDSSIFLYVGVPLSYPVNIKDIKWKASVEKPVAGILNESYVDKPLFIYNNTIRYYNIFDSSSIFYDTSTNISIILEKASFKDASSTNWDASSMYQIFPNTDTSMIGTYVLESSTGVRYYFDNYISLSPSTNDLLQYSIDENYKVPLLSLKNFTTIDINDNIVSFEPDKLFHLDIIDGKIAMDSSIYPTNSRMYINFTYDESINKQYITLNVEYESPRMSLYVIDPSIYYWADPSGLSGGVDSSGLIIDNSIYNMTVNHIGDYNIEAFAWDGYNTLFYNPRQDNYNVWIKYPTIYAAIDQSINLCYSTLCSSSWSDTLLTDISLLVHQNVNPIYDRFIPLTGLTLEYNPSNGYPFIKIPTYFQDSSIANYYNRFYNLTEKVIDISSNIEITLDNSSYQYFLMSDDVEVVAFDNGKYSIISETSSYISSVVNSKHLILDASLPFNFVINSSIGIYVLNETKRLTTNIVNDYVNKAVTLDVSGYIFKDNQLVGIVVEDVCTGYDWYSSYRVTNVSGASHTFDTELLRKFVDESSTRYTITAKHTYSNYAEIELNVDDASKYDKYLHIYFNDNCEQYFLDNTFTMLNGIPFSIERVNKQWYDPSYNMINSNFYNYTDPIEIDISTLVIMRSIYDVSTYLFNQKNIWTIKENISKNIVMRTFNEAVPFIFDASGYYDIECASYDAYGNLSSKNHEGLVKIVNTS